MNKIAIDRVVQKRFREAGKHFRQLKYHASVDPVHDFRVEIKKLRAILRLLSMADHVAIKIPSKLKKIYSKAGIIRELQVLQIRNKKEKALTDFSIKQIRNTQKKETSALNELARSHSIAADKKEVVALLPKNIAFRTVINFFSTKLAEINRLLYLKRITDEVMHSIRKILKDLLYVAQLLEKEMHFRFPNSVWNKSKETWYLQISYALGDYHEYSVEK
jgi:CHAD domain-containing protein